MSLVSPGEIAERAQNVNKAFAVVEVLLTSTCPHTRHLLVALDTLETARMWSLKAATVAGPSQKV